jgi:hypothetical protein
MAKWCVVADVEKRLAAVGGLVIDEPEIEEYIDDAMAEIKSELSAAYPIATITAWSSAVPPRIAKLTADLASQMFLKDNVGDFTGRVGDRDSTYGFMKRLRDGEAEIYNASDEIISRTGSQVKFNKSGKTPIFSMGNEGDGTLGEGSLVDLT